MEPVRCVKDRQYYGSETQHNTNEKKKIFFQNGDSDNAFSCICILQTFNLSIRQLQW